MNFYVSYFLTIIAVFAALYFFKKSKYYQKIKNRHGAKYGRAAFWMWIAYQTIKGIATTSLLWAPMIYHYFGFDK